MTRQGVGVIALATALTLAAANDDVATWTTKLGFIPGTKPDVETGFMTVEEGKRRCALKNDCLAITFRDAPDVQGKIHLYLKSDSTVSESDKCAANGWTLCACAPADCALHLPPGRGHRW